jgi:ribonuclease-3
MPEAQRLEHEASTHAFATRLSHRFARPELLAEALTHRSAADPRRQLLDSNERLEFLGDRVLALVMAEWLAERFPQEREGALGKRLAALVSAESLARVAERMDLSAALRVPPGEKRAGVGNRASVLADALEALLGALFLDGGLDPARALVRREFLPLLEASDRPPVSAKTRLQEWLQGRGLGLPDYVLVSSFGPSHSPIFVVRAVAAGQEAEGMGETKRAAEQAAAEALIGKLGA